MPPGRRSPEDAIVTDQVAKLIELGRDREAAELGARAETQGGRMEALDQMDQLGPALTKVIEGIRPDQLDNPTPCSKFTVRGVLEHMAGGATVFAAAFRGMTPPTPDLSDAVAATGTALGDLMGALHEPGALDGTVAAPFGEIAREDFVRFLVLDGLCHGWDIATATGQPYDPPDEIVAEAEAFGRGVIDPLRDGDTFAAATEPPAGATPIERLVAYTGRTVQGGGR